MCHYFLVFHIVNGYQYCWNIFPKKIHESFSISNKLFIFVYGSLSAQQFVCHISLYLRTYKQLKKSLP